MATRRTTSVRPGQFKHLTALHSFVRVYQSAIWPCCGLLTTGIRVTELALLEVADLLYPSGAIKPEVNLRANITKGLEIFTRRIPGVSLPTTRGLRCVIGAAGGFPPMRNLEACPLGSKLVLSHKGQSFELVFKHCQLANRPIAYLACDALQQTITRLLQAGRDQTWIVTQWHYFRIR